MTATTTHTHPYLQQSLHYYNNGRQDHAWHWVEKYLMEVNFKDPYAMLIAYGIQKKAERYTTAYFYAKRATELAPREFSSWQAYATCLAVLCEFDKAEDAYRKSLKYATLDEERCSGLANWGGARVSRGDFKGSIELTEAALNLNPEHVVSRGNYGTALLGMGQWERGWDYYDFSYSDSRYRFSLGSNDTPWNGETGKRIAIMGEQGLGDEISFASMVPDAIRVSEHVVLDVDPRLVKLFRRSFPEASVYGTRFEQQMLWDESDAVIHHTCSIGQLGRFFRNTPRACPGTPYLIADPEATQRWREQFHANGKKPVIGVGTYGGTPKNGSKFRQWSLYDLMPLFTAFDAHWVCLDYKDVGPQITKFREETGIDIVQYPQLITGGTSLHSKQAPQLVTITPGGAEGLMQELNEYDDTAAIVLACDAVFSVQTSVIHLAGALGVPTFCFVHMYPQWRYGADGHTIPWYNSVKLYRQRPDKSWPMNEGIADLKALVGSP